MSYSGLRGWLAKVEEIGALRKISGVDPELEMGALYEMAQQRKSKPALLFENIPGFPPGYRIATTSTNRRIAAITFGLPDGLTELEMTQALREKLADLRRIPPKVVDSGPVMENVHLGEEVDLFEFPVPFWHELDGGHYIGTRDLVVTRDPDEGWVNVGTYRVQRHDKNTLGFYISPGKHGRIHREKYYAKGEPCPVLISFGHDPLLQLLGSAALPWGVCEYEYARGLKGEPLEVVKGPVTGLPVPADAEIVIEGESYPGETRTEGPFGEFTGYYASGERSEPIIHVKSVLHRKDPIMSGTPPIKPCGGTSVEIMRSATVWNGLERAGIPDIVGVGCYMSFFITVVSIRQRYPGHSRQAGAVAGQLPGGAYCGRWIIVVDEDIDPTNFDDVLWALATRVDPSLSIDILHRCWSTALDPMSNTGLPGNDLRMFNSRAIVDACVPYELKSKRLFPAVVGASPELRAKVEAKYGALLK